jgi:hypothetical protein
MLSPSLLFLKNPGDFMRMVSASPLFSRETISPVA